MAGATEPDSHKTVTEVTAGQMRLTLQNESAFMDWFIQQFDPKRRYTGKGRSKQVGTSIRAMIDFMTSERTPQETVQRAGLHNVDAVALIKNWFLTKNELNFPEHEVARITANVDPRIRAMLLQHTYESYMRAQDPTFKMRVVKELRVGGAGADAPPVEETVSGGACDVEAASAAVQTGVTAAPTAPQPETRSNGSVVTRTEAPASTASQTASAARPAMPPAVAPVSVPSASSAPSLSDVAAPEFKGAFALSRLPTQQLVQIFETQEFADWWRSLFRADASQLSAATLEYLRTDGDARRIAERHGIDNKRTSSTMNKGFSGGKRGVPKELLSDSQNGFTPKNKKAILDFVAQKYFTSLSPKQRGKLLKALDIDPKSLAEAQPIDEETLSLLVTTGDLEPHEIRVGDPSVIAALFDSVGSADGPIQITIKAPDGRIVSGEVGIRPRDASDGAS